MQCIYFSNRTKWLHWLFNLTSTICKLRFRFVRCFVCIKTWLANPKSKVVNVKSIAMQDPSDSACTKIYSPLQAIHLGDNFSIHMESSEACRNYFLSNSKVIGQKRSLYGIGGILKNVRGFVHLYGIPVKASTKKRCALVITFFVIFD